jgi:hypothetical protein
MAQAAVTLHRISTKAFLRALLPRTCLPPAKPRKPRVSARLLGTLQLQPGRLYTWAELVDSAYGDDPEGGPLNALGSIKVLLHHLRRAGYPIERYRRGGASLMRVGQAGRTHRSGTGRPPPGRLGGRGIGRRANRTANHR